MVRRKRKITCPSIIHWRTCRARRDANLKQALIDSEERYRSRRLIQEKKRKAPVIKPIRLKKK